MVARVAANDQALFLALPLVQRQFGHISEIISFPPLQVDDFYLCAGLPVEKLLAN
jgi:hypothetical protein